MQAAALRSEEFECSNRMGQIQTCRNSVVLAGSALPGVVTACHVLHHGATTSGQDVTLVRPLEGPRAAREVRDRLSHQRVLTGLFRPSVGLCIGGRRTQVRRDPGTVVRSGRGVSMLHELCTLPREGPRTAREVQRTNGFLTGLFLSVRGELRAGGRVPHSSRQISN